MNLRVPLRRDPVMRGTMGREIWLGRQRLHLQRSERQACPNDPYFTADHYHHNREKLPMSRMHYDGRVVIVIKNKE